MPGKVLTKCVGKPLLQWTIDRVKTVKIKTDIVVATSTEITDDVIYRYCISNNINCYRGSLKNVILRFIETCNNYKASTFIRICGDSPIIDPKIIDEAIKISEENNFDVITNVAKRTFPKGQSVEIIKLSALKKLYEERLTPNEKEHVTAGFYNRKDKFSILNFESNEEKFCNMQLSVDTYQDFKKIEYLIKLEQKPSNENYFGWQKFSMLSEKFYAQK